MHDLRNIWSNKLTDYVQTLHVSNLIKNKIFNKQNVKKPTQSYLYYPLLFKDCFQFKQQDVLDKLCLAGFLHYRSLLDNASISKKDRHEQLVSSICQNEAMRQYLSVFPSGSSFWEYWTHREADYRKAVVSAKALPLITTLSEYETYADNTAVFGKIIIDALHILSDEKFGNIYNQLLTAHRQFSVGCQIICDIRNFCKGAESADTILNWAHIHVNRYINSNEDTQSNWSIARKYKHLYTSGLAITLIQDAINYFFQARSIAQELGLFAWQQIIDQQSKAAIFLKIHFEAYAKITAAHPSHVTRTHELQQDVDRINKSFLQDCLAAGEAFLISAQNEDGSWQDFHTNNGLSNCWVTGYVLSQIAEITLVKGAIKTKAAQFLQRYHQDESGWGYNNEFLLTDTDSTTAALLGLELSRQPMYTQFNEWTSWQRKDGGFGTFNNYNELFEFLDGSVHNLEGWMQSHVCVSALAYYLLIKASDHPLIKERVCSYLLNARTESGLWDSYWWTSPIYSTCYVIQGLLADNKSVYGDIVDKAVTALLKNQLPNGSFAIWTADLAKPSAYYTGLVLDTLCADVALFSHHRHSAERVCKWLLTNQLRDGSWNSSGIMRIPTPSIITPQTEVSVWRSSSSGPNIIVEDSMRNFTTSVCMKAISSYNDCLGMLSELGVVKQIG